MIDSEYENNFEEESVREERQATELYFLFGEEIVEQARLIEIGVLNITDEMTAAIGEGIRQLKQLKNDPEAQRQWIVKQEAGLQLLLCLWIMDMGLIEKIRK